MMLAACCYIFDVLLIFFLSFFSFFFFNDPATTEIYTVSDTFPTRRSSDLLAWQELLVLRQESNSLLKQVSAVRSEEHTSELQSPDTISYAVFCLKKKKK